LFAPNDAAYCRKRAQGLPELLTRFRPGGVSGAIFGARLEVSMRFVGFAVAGLLLGVVPASAQYLEAPRPPGAIGPGLLNDAAEIAEAMGLKPVGPAIRSGAFLVQRATDDFGRVLRVTVDARRSQVIAVEAVGAPRGPYATYGRPYPGDAMPGTPEGLEPRGSAMESRVPPQVAVPPHSASIAPDLPVPPAPSVAPAKPKTKSAAVTPQQPQTAPTPRKRPPAAPSQATGSVEPITRGAAPQATAPQAAPTQQPPAAAPPAPAKPEITMPPVAPLE
jgi:hypothetical protein